MASSTRIAKIAFTGETTTGRMIMQYASTNLIPSTLELGGKSPNIFFKDVMDEDDAYLDKCIEGLVMFALNQGEVCTCPSRALIHEDIYDEGSIWTADILYSTIKRWSGYSNKGYEMYDNENYYQPILIRAHTDKNFNSDLNCDQYDVYLSH